jgi:hypothetical protein
MMRPPDVSVGRQRPYLSEETAHHYRLKTITNTLLPVPHPGVVDW